MLTKTTPLPLLMAAVILLSGAVWPGQAVTAGAEEVTETTEAAEGSAEESTREDGQPEEAPEEQGAEAEPAVEIPEEDVPKAETPDAGPDGQSSTENGKEEKDPTEQDSAGTGAGAADSPAQEAAAEDAAPDGQEEGSSGQKGIADILVSMELREQERQLLLGVENDVAISAAADAMVQSLMDAAAERPMVLALTSDLNEDIYNGDDMPFDPYTERTADDVNRMLEYAKWWRGQGVRYGTSWVSKNSKYYDGSKSFHYLKKNGRSDCSWFVYNILKKFGYVNHFVSSTKWGEDSKQYPGAHVVKGNLSKARPGDVICTGKPELGSAHVALYVGDGYVIECTFSGIKLTKASRNPRRIVHFDCNP